MITMLLQTLLRIGLHHCGNYQPRAFFLYDSLNDISIIYHFFLLNRVFFSPFKELTTTLSLFLKNAKHGGYAVGAFNVYNLEGIQAVVAAAEAERSPAILQVNSGFGNDDFCMKSLFQMKIEVPISYCKCVNKIIPQEDESCANQEKLIDEKGFARKHFLVTEKQGHITM